MILNVNFDRTFRSVVLTDLIPSKTKLRNREQLSLVLFCPINIYIYIQPSPDECGKLRAWHLPYETNLS